MCVHLHLFIRLGKAAMATWNELAWELACHFATGQLRLRKGNGGLTRAVDAITFGPVDLLDIIGRAVVVVADNDVVLSIDDVPQVLIHAHCLTAVVHNEFCEEEPTRQNEDVSTQRTVSKCSIYEKSEMSPYVNGHVVCCNSLV